MKGLVSLEAPSLALLDAYATALRGGWSPNTTRNVAPEELAAIAHDPDAFLGGLEAVGTPIHLPNGEVVKRIPGRVRWILADDRPGRPFVGAINLRWQVGGDGRPVTALPEHVLGHVGYSILPAFAGRGYASAALAGIVDLASGIGLAHLEITCDAGNRASRRVIEKNGGRLIESFVATRYGPDPRLRFIIGGET